MLLKNVIKINVTENIKLNLPLFCQNSWFLFLLLSKNSLMCLNIEIVISVNYMYHYITCERCSVQALWIAITLWE